MEVGEGRFRLGRVFVSLLRVVMCAHGLAVRSKTRSIFCTLTRFAVCGTLRRNHCGTEFSSISATSVFPFSLWGSGFTLVYQLFDAFFRIGLYECALELAAATGIVERRMAMSSAQSPGC